MSESPQAGFVPTAFAGSGALASFEALFGRGTPNGGFVALPVGETIGARPATATAIPSAEDILVQARQEAARLLAEAELEAQRRSEAAVSAATEAARSEQLAAFTAASAALLDDLRRAWDERLEQIGREAAALVVSIARRVLHEQFSADEAAIIPLVREALRPLADSQHVQVVIAPAHEATVRGAYHELAQALRDGAQLDVVVSETEPPLGCLAHGERSSVDARMENRLEALQHAVEQTLISDAA